MQTDDQRPGPPAPPAPPAPPPPAPPAGLPQQPPQQLAFLAATSMLTASPAIPKPKRKRREDDSVEDDIVASRIKEYGIKPGPGHSFIWEYFDKYKVGNDNALRTVGMCKICRNSQVLYMHKIIQIMFTNLSMYAACVIGVESSKHAYVQDFAKAEVKMGKDLSTGNLKSHLQHNHRAEYLEFVNKSAANNGTP